MWFRALAVSLVLVPTLAGCGGGGTDDETGDIKKAVQASAVQELGESTFAVSGPNYLDIAVGTPRISGLKVTKQGENVALVTGRVQAEVSVTPKPDKAELLRVVPASGGTVIEARQFAVQTIKQADDWLIGEDGFDVEDGSPRELTPEELEEARQLAVAAMKALLTFGGNVNAYEQAQGDFYATKRASEAEFNQPDFDPAPSLELKTKLGFSAWPRTTDGGEDDLTLGDLFEYPGEASGEECGTLIVRSMKPSTVSGEVTGTPIAGPVEDKVLITGQSVLRIGDWQCAQRMAFGERGTPRRVGPRETTVKYLAAVTRLNFGTPNPWFISAVELDEDRVGAGALGANSQANLYNTGSGDVEILAGSG